MAAITIIAAGYSLALRMLAEDKRVNLPELNEFFEDPSRPLVHCAELDQVADSRAKGPGGPQLATALKMLGMIFLKPTYFPG